MGQVRLRWRYISQVLSRLHESLFPAVSVIALSRIVNGAIKSNLYLHSPNMPVACVATEMAARASISCEGCLKIEENKPKEEQQRAPFQYQYQQRYEESEFDDDADSDFGMSTTLLLRAILFPCLSRIPVLKLESLRATVPFGTMPHVDHLRNATTSWDTKQYTYTSNARDDGCNELRSQL
ncbi:hypothetical protein F5Y18DRAFT_53116 [Xylariaceae sp. FL1019]|nr:hypothetical protein F5Y18DRAFT_53116 [Xylariaceae sp. FL1019]